MATLKNTTISDTGFLKIATGTNAQRPSSPALGDFRYNTEEEVFEVYDGSEWVGAGGGGASLYDFTTATFTAPQTGSNAPSLTQVRNNISGGDAFKNNTEYLSVVSGIVYWSAPADGTYRVECWGARGGGPCTRQGTNGGLGARMRGDFNFTSGQVLYLVIGQEGIRQTNGWGGGGGGGGTFVWDPNSLSQPLIAAGGGGGSGQNSNGQQDGRTGGTGGTGSNGGGSGGSSGSASGSSGICGGGGGQGWNGGSSYHCGGGFTWPTLYNNPTGYSSGGHSTNMGGFGGGSGSYGGSGGGGGWSGGGSGGWSYAGYGGGGGSINSGSNQSNTSGVKSGGGQITITLL
jgi:hypothetical protein